jgi:secernin
VIFGKNSDRPKGEGQSIHRYPAKDYIKSTNNEDELLLLACTYISIPQVPHTHAVLLSQIDWMWGVEHGVNEHGVAIGNEAVWTKVKDDEDMSVKRLLGMDLVRLGLERGGTAQEALEVITTLLQVHGQGGPCSEDGDPTFCYHNSFLIADSREAWVLETAGRHWVAQRCTKGGRNISNALTIRTDYDLSSNGLEEYAQQKKLWNPTTTTNTKLDWAKCFGEEGTIEECESKFSRHGCGRALLEKHSTTSSSGTLTVQGMMEILRNHGSGICMHGGFETTASMVCELQARRHWMMDTPHPCQNEYQEQSVILLEKG